MSLLTAFVRRLPFRLRFKPLMQQQRTAWWVKGRKSCSRKMSRVGGLVEATYSPHVKVSTRNSPVSAALAAAGCASGPPTRAARLVTSPRTPGDSQRPVLQARPGVCTAARQAGVYSHSIRPLLWSLKRSTNTYGRASKTCSQRHYELEKSKTSY